MPFRIGIDARKLSDPGIGSYIRELIHALGDIDRENQYFLFVGRPDQEDLADLPANFVEVVENSPAYSLREFLALSWRILRLRLDLYHATHYALPAIVPCKAVVTVHDVVHLFHPEFLPSALAFFYAQRMIRRTLLRADRVLADSRNSKTDLMNYFEIDGRKIRVIYPGLAGDVSNEPKSGDGAQLEELHLQQPYALFVGSRKAVQNLDNVVRAYARALEIHPAKVILVAPLEDGGSSFKVEHRVSQLDLGGRVRLLQDIAPETMDVLFRKAKVIIYPTLEEGADRVVARAMAAGVPVITSDSSSMKEMAEGYAHLVNPLDVESLARAISHCIADEEHSAALVKLGLRRAEDFRWPQTAVQTLEVYRNVLAQKEKATSAAAVRP